MAVPREAAVARAPGPAVGRGSCIFITEGPKTVALFRVEHVEVPVQAERPAPFPPNGSLRLRVDRQRQLLARGDQWSRAATTALATAS